MTPPAVLAAPETATERRRGEAVLAPAAERGTLDIADVVVEKIAATALGKVADIGGVARRILGVPLGAEDPDRLADVHATVTGTVVVLQVRVTVAYPAPVAATTDRARRHLVDRIGELTGLHTERVDITVTALTAPAATPRVLR